MKTLADESMNEQCPVVIADRINTQRVHRQDVFGAMKTVGIRVVVIWEMSVKDAIGRIKQRRFGHRTIGPESNVGMIVGRTAKEFEPLSADETDLYGIRKVVVIREPMSFSRHEIIKMILAELSDINGLEFLEINRISDSDIDNAISKTVKREESISFENEKTISHRRPKNEHTSLPEAKEGRYEIRFPKHVDTLLKLSKEFGNKTLANKSEFHVTLLYINRKLSKMISSQECTSDDKLHDGDTKIKLELLQAIKSYETLGPKDIPVNLVYIARNERVMAARVNIGDIAVKYFDVVPHISLAKVEDAEFREANNLIECCDRLRSDKHPQGTDGIHWIDISRTPRIYGRIQFSRHGSQ